MASELKILVLTRLEKKVVAAFAKLKESKAKEEVFCNNFVFFMAMDDQFSD